ncbi:hypothetical protein JF546_15555 [Nitratireductor aquimarinus]|uniref:DUF4333 domain-containing protein n=1 Tax=Nitratireductor aquimarinus TaxID=889300 RepID=A0ABU4AHP1_9HYPH|nr:MULTISPECIES: hypothetical protein [Alphaproteobacteria]MBY6022795.1 hypothetical protein [Nitratireductor sp. DP7N14-4]MBN7758003.1 hypothetical protein [Nitratireductor aquimarinus]MBN7762466.1 hypothetical protein [Nitratireductor aquibiodomus]MBN8244435.1 hypothetical protein [Nitratireductor aquimarinus]MBY6000765.1 hypothetical protein [Tritonibacter mobilis]
MEHIAALLLIVGCSGNVGAGDTRECQELPAPTPVYETFEECEAEKPVAMRELETEAPQVLATCVYVDPALVYDDAILEWDITSNGELTASIEPVTSFAVAQNEHARPGHAATK